MERKQVVHDQIVCKISLPIVWFALDVSLQVPGGFLHAIAYRVNRFMGTPRHCAMVPIQPT